MHFVLDQIRGYNGVLNFYFHLFKILQYTPTVDIKNGCSYELLKLFS
jgi:hypothetical protein